VEQSRGRSLDFVGVSREVLDLREGTPPNKQEKRLSSKKNAFQARKIPSKTRKILFKQGDVFQSRGIFQSNVEVYKW
jgi:hypothetical protein